MGRKVSFFGIAANDKLPDCLIFTLSSELMFSFSFWVFLCSLVLLHNHVNETEVDFIGLKIMSG